MNIFYSNETLFVDLFGEVEINKVRNKVFSILNEYNILNNKITKFFIDSFFKLNKSYRRIEAATDKNER